VGLWLLFFLGVLAWVVARQTSAYALATELTAARNQRSALEAQRAALVQRIRAAESRAVLIPRARNLGLRLPIDSEIQILIVRPPDAERR
jgi:hypothetical protein